MPLKIGDISEKGGTKYHRNFHDIIQMLSAIQLFARRGGVKHISRLIYEDTHDTFKLFARNGIRDSVTYTGHTNRKIFSAMYVLYALKWASVVRSDVSKFKELSMGSIYILHCLKNIAMLEKPFIYISYICDIKILILPLEKYIDEQF